MQPHHRLCLPLPPGYQSPTVVGGQYSTFHNAVQDDSQVTRYLTDLTGFLSRHRLIQYHPENYFGYRLTSEMDASSKPQLHLDGTQVRDTEVVRLRRMCGAFAKLMTVVDRTVEDKQSGSHEPSSSPVMLSLQMLIRDGPAQLISQYVATHPLNNDGASPDSNNFAELQAFYDMSKQLMLHRTRREGHDYSTATFTPLHNVKNLVADPTPGDDVFRLLVDFSMGEKKQHEVTVMRYVLRDLMSNTCGASDCERCSLMNIGEGKGYVSRVMALCDGFQVIGLDCNPGHKEGSSGRIEKLVEGRLGLGVVSPNNDTPTTSSGPNLLYTPRGHMASVTCTVEQSMDWSSVLRGHCPVYDEVTGVTTRPSESEGCAQDENGNGVALTVKVQCLVCGHIMRKHSVAMVIKHARFHVDRAVERMSRTDGKHCDEAVLRDFRTQSPLSMQPVAFDSFIKNAAQHEVWSTILTSFFTEDVQFIPKKKCSGEEETGGEGKRRPRSDDNCVEERRRAELSYPPLELEDGVFARGARLKVLCRLQLELMLQDQTANEEHHSPDSTAAAGRVVVRSAVVAATCTVLGFDEGSRRHKVAFEPFPDLGNIIATTSVGGAPARIVNEHNLAKQFTCLIIHRPQPASDETDSTILSDAYLQHVQERCAKSQRAISTSTTVLPVVVCIEEQRRVAPTTVAIHCPSLRNVVMMGLHTCGDLGSSVCRLFATSRAQALCLVSCCWHALTNEGFPLSNAVKAFDYTTESISLMLATQPLDMWSSFSAEGHRGSARLLFFRGLMALVWKLLEQQQRHSCSAQCPFPLLPHLEPPFLRRMAKVKNEISLKGFVTEVYHEYCDTPQKRKRFKTPAFPLKVTTEEALARGELCDSCAAAFAALFTPSEGGTSCCSIICDAIEAQHTQESFHSFLGLTVLRMWMSHLLEGLLLVDRALYLHESMCQDATTSSDVTLAPFFDGTLSPRMFGILARRL